MSKGDRQRRGTPEGFTVELSLLVYENDKPNDAAQARVVFIIPDKLELATRFPREAQAAQARLVSEAYKALRRCARTLRHWRKP